jgi:hypothetical protein
VTQSVDINVQSVYQNLDVKEDMGGAYYSSRKEEIHFKIISS